MYKLFVYVHRTGMCSFIFALKKAIVLSRIIFFLIFFYFATVFLLLPLAVLTHLPVLSSVLNESDDVLLAGDSAGGTLALGAWQRVQERRLTGLVLVSPWLDLTDDRSDR